MFLPHTFYGRDGYFNSICHGCESAVDILMHKWIVGPWGGLPRIKNTIKTIYH